MRRSGTLLIALLLATAAAAGAGDNIKWKRAKNLTYVTPGNETPSALADPEEMFEQYTLSWSNPHGKDIYEIVATYVAWDFIYTHLSESFAAGHMDLEEFTAGLEKGRENFENKINLLVTVLADEERHARLSNRHYWNVSLQSGVEKFQPSKIELRESSFEEGLVKSPNETGSGTPIRLSMKTYVVTFDHPYKIHVPASIKLILLCDDCRRGFEWRFVEE
ncbi:MAG: hypothetical protein V3T41_09270 [bacterium]